MARVLAAALVLLCALAPAAASARTAAPEAWPPVQGPGTLFVHYGEEHWNDEDGMTLLPKVVEDVIRYRPTLVTMSGDKANDGDVEQLSKWKEIMAAYDRAGIPYLAGVGNHDRLQPEGIPGGTSPFGDISNYLEVFADRPWPMGDARPYQDEAFRQRERPADDPPGASTHYFADVGPVRWIFLDNSCFGITNCQQQQGQDGTAEGQFDFLKRVAQGAQDEGRLAFVVMHMPTQDPRDQSYTDTTAVNHVMGKGISPDNLLFEQVAVDTGIDGVFLGHIKGQFLYAGRGGIPYYIDGGAGGELYTTGPIGTDHGYWHGYRLVRVAGGEVVTDTVPILVPDGITVEGPARAARGEEIQLAAFGKQPVFKDPAKVERLELRDPDPVEKNSVLGAGSITVGRWVLGPLALLLLAGIATQPGLRRRRPRAAALGAFVLLGAASTASFASTPEPTSTPRASLPAPARIWTSSDADVLRPLASRDDDPRRDTATQTDSGRFLASCPGRAEVTITAGWQRRSHAVTVAGEPGPLVRSVRRGTRSLRRGRGARLAVVDLAQSAVVRARVVTRSGRTVRDVSAGCVPRRRLGLRWDGRDARGRKAARGRYSVVVTVLGERGKVQRRYPFVVR